MSREILTIKGCAASEAKYQIISPVDGNVYAEVDDAEPASVDAVVARAKRAKEFLTALTDFERADLCRSTADALLSRTEELAEVIAWETGRPLASGRDEVQKAAWGLQLAAEEGVRLNSAVVPVRDRTKITMTTRHPTGIWAILSPWNFPVNIPVEYLGPALAVGNPVVWKPAPSTAASARVLWESFQSAGVPTGAINLLTTDQLPTVRALLEHPDVIGVGLTGSTATGRAVARSVPGKHLVLELGGNGPLLVYGDADLALAAKAAASGAFAASGQICSSTGRVFVEESVAERFAELVVEETKTFRLGNPFDEDTVMGPLHDQVVADRVSEQIADAVAQGARVISEPDERSWPTRTYMAAQVVTNVPVGCSLEAEESFGPVVPIVPVPDGEDLVDLANNGVHALSVGVFTKDIDRALNAARRLEFGSVIINDRAGFWELHLPFGGWEGLDSGTGRVGVPAMVQHMTQYKTTSLTINQGL